MAQAECRATKTSKSVAGQLGNRRSSGGCISLTSPGPLPWLHVAVEMEGGSPLSNLIFGAQPGLAGLLAPTRPQARVACGEFSGFRLEE